MIVAKFGGTSLADATAIRHAARRVCDHPETAVVVVSATAGTTNALIELTTEPHWRPMFTAIKNRHMDIAHALDLQAPFLKALEAECKALEDVLSSGTSHTEHPQQTINQIICWGERLSAQLMAGTLNQLGWSVTVADARQFVVARQMGFGVEPDVPAIKRAIVNGFPDIDQRRHIAVTQGFVASDDRGQCLCLGRGGSDLSASLFAEALGADAVHIWTDVAGIWSADPRLVTDARHVPVLSFAEAAELAVYGAKVLHPKTLWPAIRASVPIYVASTQQPDQDGTWIHPDVCHRSPQLRAISHRPTQKLVTLTSLRMLHTPGFLARVFDVLNRFGISVDLITTSEVTVALTVDQPVTFDRDVIDALRPYAEVKVEDNHHLIALIGCGLNFQTGVARMVFDALRGFNVRMMFQGASDSSMALLVDENDAVMAINRLHQCMIEEVAV